MTTTTRRITLLALVLILALSVFAFASCDSLLPENTDVIFELNNNGTGYWVTKEGNFVAEELTIPATHEGLPVVGVKANAFKNNKTIKLPIAIVTIKQIKPKKICSPLQPFINFPLKSKFYKVVILLIIILQQYSFCNNYFCTRVPNLNNF